MTNNIRQFTLIELLTVIVVISVIVGITIPAYTRMMTGNAVTHANHLITSQLNMARTHACQKRRAVAVLFPDYNLADYYNSTLKDPVALRAYRSAYVEEGTSGWEFAGWVEGTKWEYLPKGAFFPTTDANIASGAKDADGLIPSATVTIGSTYLADITGDLLFSSANTTIPASESFRLAIIFKENGRPVVSSGSPQVKVCQGVVTDNADTSGMVTKTNTDNWLKAKVNRYTGAVVTESP